MALMDISINETRILHTIWMNPGISRIGVSRMLNLNKSTVTKIINSFLEEELVTLSDTPDKMDSKGRRPTGLYVNRNMGVVIGLEIKTDSWHGAIIDVDGHLLERLSGEAISQGSDLLTAVESAMKIAVAKVEGLNKMVLGAGLGLSGLVNPYEGLLISSNPLNIHQPLNLHKHFEKRFPFPVVLENDANCCCWNVFLEKKSAHDRNFLCLLGEYRRTGIGPMDGSAELKGIAIGMGLVLKDSVHHGERFSAGEFQSVFKHKINASQFDLTTEQIERINSDPAIWNKVIRELAKNTAMLVNVLNISLIKIFGDFIKDPATMASVFLDEVQNNWLGYEQVDCTVEISGQGKDSVAIGAAGFFLHRAFSLPDLWEEREIRHPGGIELLRKALYRL